MRRALLLVVCVSLIASSIRSEDPPSHDTLPPPRTIPGLTAPDHHPRACVSCHVDMPEMGIDARLSTAMMRWTTEVDPKLIATARRAMAKGASLEGRHPDASASLDDIPDSCIACHRANSDRAPDFARLIHLAHLTGGGDNHFLTIFQGECTHCHKIDPDTGEWSIPSASE